MVETATGRSRSWNNVDADRRGPRPSRTVIAATADEARMAVMPNAATFADGLAVQRVIDGLAAGEAGGEGDVVFGDRRVDGEMVTTELEHPGFRR